MKPRRHNDQPFDQYVKENAVNASALRAGRRSMQHMHAVMHGEHKAPTPAMLLGTALHTAVLEPLRFTRCACVPPAVDRRTKAGKEAYQQWLDTTGPDAIILDLEDYNAVLAAHASIIAAGGLDMAGEGNSEVSVYWEEQIRATHLACKARLDWLGYSRHSDRKAGLIIDIKTTRDASPHAFARSAASYGYIHQAAWYMRAAKRLHQDGQGPSVTDYLIIAVEMDAPHAVGLYKIAEADLAAADDENMAMLARWARAIEDDDFPGPTNGEVQTLCVPQWLFGDRAERADASELDDTIPF